MLVVRVRCNFDCSNEATRKPIQIKDRLESPKNRWTYFSGTNNSNDKNRASREANNNNEHNSSNGSDEFQSKEVGT